MRRARAFADVARRAAAARRRDWRVRDRVSRGARCALFFPARDRVEPSSTRRTRDARVRRARDFNRHRPSRPRLCRARADGHRATSLGEGIRDFFLTRLTRSRRIFVATGRRVVGPLEVVTPRNHLARVTRRRTVDGARRARSRDIRGGVARRSIARVARSRRAHTRKRRSTMRNR